MQLSLIVAQNAKRVIGKDGQIPWHVSEDLKHFKTLTLNHSVIMGKRTFLSIGKPLPQRRNIVVSSTLDPKEGILVCKSLEEALALCCNEAEVFVIGGARLYAESLNLAQTLYLTGGEKECAGDTYFPEFKHLGFKEVERSPRYLSDKEQIYYSFVTYQRA